MTAPDNTPKKPIKNLHEKRHADHQTVIRVKEMTIGGELPVLMAGPCAVENYDQIKTVAKTLKRLGIPCLRAGAFKPRTSPYSFQGMGEEGVHILAQVAREMNLAVISEVMSIEQIGIMEPHIDILQVGSRNMQNFDLLKALGQSKRPVLLKRGLSATLSEFLNCAEYIMAHGNPHVILCERGIRSFDSATRNVLDLGAVAWLQTKTHLPVIVDPSHATGVRELVIPCSRAAVALGASGLIVEAHPEPSQSVSDAEQALSLDELETLVAHMDVMAEALKACHGQTAVSQPVKMRA